MKTEKIEVRLSEQLKQQAEEMAKKKQMHLSEFIRYLLQREIDTQKKT
jgi:antitoxin component of RelBE/YafQ-DinJ toxin-antitoxin module